MIFAANSRDSITGVFCFPTARLKYTFIPSTGLVPSPLLEMLKCGPRPPAARLLGPTLCSTRRALHSTSRRHRELFDPANVERASDDVDVCIVGGGPAGLSAAIRLKQLEQEKGREIRVVVLEKGGEVGGSYLYPIYNDTRVTDISL